jgi:hypothetical protein
MDKILIRLFIMLAIMVVISSATRKRLYEEHEDSFEQPKFSLRDILQAISDSRMALRGEALPNPKRLVCFV